MSNEPESRFLLYQTSDGQTRLEFRLENETVWLSQNQMAELFQTTKQNVSLHIRNKRVRENNAFIKRVLERPKLWLMGEQHGFAA